MTEDQAFQHLFTSNHTFLSYLVAKKVSDCDLGGSKSQSVLYQEQMISAVFTTDVVWLTCKQFGRLGNDLKQSFVIVLE